MNLSKIGRYIFLAGVIIAIVAGIFSLRIPNLGAILAVLGLIVGLLNVTSAETRTFLIAGIAFLATASALTSVAATIGLGMQMSAIASYLTAFTAPAVLVVAIKSLMGTAVD